MSSQDGVRDIIVIGASAGGVEPLGQIFSALPPDFPGVIAVVIHRSPFYVIGAAEVWGPYSSLPVAEAADGDAVQGGRIYFAPPDMHLVMEKEQFRLLRTAKVNFTRPAVNPLFESAAEAHGSRVVGVVLSGGGSDGVNGLIAIKAAGGLSIVQRPSEAAHPSMPVNALLFDDVDAVLSLEEIGPTLRALVMGDVKQHAG